MALYIYIYIYIYVKDLTKHPVYINLHSLNVKQIFIIVITQTSEKISNISKDTCDNDYVINECFLDLKNMAKINDLKYIMKII